MNHDVFFNLIDGFMSYFQLLITTFGIYLNNLLYATKADIIPASAVTSVGVSLTALFFCLEMFSQVAQFRMERIEDAIRLAMRFIVAKIIIENTNGISNGIYSIFRIASSGSIIDACDSITNSIGTVAFDRYAATDNFGISIIICFLGVIILSSVFVFTFFKIALTIVGIAFEIGVHQAVAPIALSTLCNDLARPTGIAFIKSYAAACLQIVVIASMFKVFGGIFQKLSLAGINLTNGAVALGLFAPLIRFISPLVCLIALSKAIKIASDLTKRMFGA